MQHEGNSAPQTAPAPKYRNWRHRKAAVARRKALEDESAARKPQLMAACVEAKGGAGRVGPLEMLDIERAVDLALMTAELRAEVRLGRAKVSQLTTLEGHADRAWRRLNLPAPGAAAAPTQTLQDYLANHQAAEAEGDG
jgi:hypothetical protein